MSTFEGLSTGRSGDSRSHHWRLVVDGNVAYHLTRNAGKSQNKYAFFAMGDIECVHGYERRKEILRGNWKQKIKHYCSVWTVCSVWRSAVQPIQVENQIERSKRKPAMSASSLVFSGEARARMRGVHDFSTIFSGRRYNYAIMWDFPQKTPIDLLKKL
jgi:hypothetical protein